MKSGLIVWTNVCALCVSCSLLDARRIEVSGPIEDVSEVSETVREMRADAEASELLQGAEGLFIIPSYAVGALLVGGIGGEGVLVARGNEGEWGDPVFYNIESAELQLPAGSRLGSIVMVLQTEDSVSRFLSGRKFVVSDWANLTIHAWTAAGRHAAPSQDPDIVLWSDVEGLLARSSFEFYNIKCDRHEVSQYYGKSIDARQILKGEIENPHDNPLSRELSQSRSSLTALAR